MAIEVASPAATGSAASQVAAADPVRDRCLEPDPSHQSRTERCSAEGSAARRTGGLLSASRPSTELVQTLLAGSDQYEWVAAAIGSNTASGYQLATQKSVMPIGGFNGSDPSPTLAEFQQYVAAGKIHYFIAGGGFGGQNGGSDEAQQIASWVEQNFSPRRSTA